MILRQKFIHHSGLAKNLHTPKKNRSKVKLAIFFSISLQFDSKFDYFFNRPRIKVNIWEWSIEVFSESSVLALEFLT